MQSSWHAPVVPTSAILLFFYSPDRHLSSLLQEVPIFLYPEHLPAVSSSATIFLAIYKTHLSYLLQESPILLYTWHAHVVSALKSTFLANTLHALIVSTLIYTYFPYILCAHNVLQYMNNFIFTSLNDIILNAHSGFQINGFIFLFFQIKFYI